MVQNLEVVCTACSHCHTSSSDASFKDSRGCSLCWASLSHNLSRRSSRPPSSKPTPPSVYSSRCVIPMARPPATVNTCSSSSPTSIFLLAHMRQPCSTPPHMVPHSGRWSARQSHPWRWSWGPRTSMWRSGPHSCPFGSSCRLVSQPSMALAKSLWD